MELLKKRVGFWDGATGLAGVALLACAACCVPLVAPLLAWLGFAGFTLMGPYGMLAAAFGVAAIMSVMLRHRHRRAQRQGSESGAALGDQTGPITPCKC
jgi:hypothetical protein